MRFDGRRGHDYKLDERIVRTALRVATSGRRRSPAFAAARRSPRPTASRLIRCHSRNSLKIRTYPSWLLSKRRLNLSKSIDDIYSCINALNLKSNFAKEFR